MEGSSANQEVPEQLTSLISLQTSALPKGQSDMQTRIEVRHSLASPLTFRSPLVLRHAYSHARNNEPRLRSTVFEKMNSHMKVCASWYSSAHLSCLRQGGPARAEVRRQDSLRYTACGLRSPAACPFGSSSTRLRGSLGASERRMNSGATGRVVSSTESTFPPREIRPHRCHEFRAHSADAVVR